MTAPQQKVSFLLTGSLDETEVDEFRGPIVQQNGSPNLSVQSNTRLSIARGTCARAPEQQAIGELLGDAAPAFGIAGNERHRNYVLYTTPDVGNRVIAEDGYETDGTGVIRDRFGTSHQNAYVPLHISRAGALAGVHGVRWPDYDGLVQPTHGIASSHNETDDETWVAWAMQGLAIAPGSGVAEPFAIYASAYDSDGTILTSPRPAVLPPVPVVGKLLHHVGLTAHGAFGTRLWFAHESGAGPDVGGIYYVSLSAVGTDMVVGPRVLVTAPDAYTRPMFGVTSDGGRYAYLACGGIGTDGVVHKVDVTTGVIEASAVVPSAVGVTADPEQIAVSYAVVGGHGRVAVVFAASSLQYALFDADVLATEVPPRTRSASSAIPGPVYAQFMLCPRSGLDGVLFGASKVDGTGGTTKADPITPNFTDTWFLPSNASATLEMDNLYGAVLIDKGSTWRVSPTEMYPLLFVAPDWGDVSKGLPGGLLEVLDPQIVGYTVGPAAHGGALQLSPVARFGIVRGTQSPVYHATKLWYPTASSNPRIGLTDADHSYLIPYKKADDDTPGRYVRLSVVPESLSVAQDRDGLAIVACALPAQWDGVETVELGGPMTAPLLNVVEDSVPGGLPAGSYGITCIYEWRDQAGLYHRSMPAPTLVVEFLTDGHALWVQATLPLTMRNGWTQGPIRVVLYMTRHNGTSYHEIEFPFRLNDDFVFMGVASEPVETRPIIYSRGLIGEEIVPQPPPPLRDIAIVGSRLWGIDAEIPTRIVYSKLRVAGIGFEFFPAGEVIVPSSAGEVVALRELSGTLILFAERGIFQVSDGGPNNIGQGGSFGPPYKLSDVGTRERQSVIGTPQGILFRDNTGGFSMLSGGGVVQLPASWAFGPVRGTFLLEHGDEACFVMDSVIRVFNYAVQRWSTWEMSFIATVTAQSAITRDRGLMYGPSPARTFTVDSKLLSSTRLMSWETDWILLGGDFQDYVVLYDVLINGRYMTEHGLFIELMTEYNGSVATTEREWTAAEITALAASAGADPSRYTVRMEPVRQDTRALKVRIRETSFVENGPRVPPYVEHEGLRPGAVTVVYSVDGITFEEANIPGSMK